MAPRAPSFGAAALWTTVTTARPLYMVVLVLSVMAVGSYLRIWGINTFGFNTDEAVYAGQAAAILGDDEFRLFPLFRAHPMIFHLNLAGVFLFTGVDDLAARLVGTIYGIATIYATYLTGRVMFGQRAAVIAALLLAVMPYHVIVSRQAMLDAPMTFFATTTLYSIAKFAATGNQKWLLVAAGMLGLTTLTKEPGIILIGSIYALLAFRPELVTRARYVAASLAIVAVMVAAFPLATMVASTRDSGKSYVIWQLLRRANHDWDFYPTEVPVAIGFPVVVAAAIAFVAYRRRWQHLLLSLWIAVPVIFFQLWPVKGYAYLLPVAPAVVLMAASAFDGLPGALRRLLRIGSGPSRTAGAVILLAVVILLARESWDSIQPRERTEVLAGAGGLPGGREAATWVDREVPDGAILLTIGPSMANVMQFYGKKQAFGLAVSPNPLHRNPSYEPVINPDLRIREGEIQYLVWDAFSAGRSEFFSDRLLIYAERYNGRIVFQYNTGDRTGGGDFASVPLIVIYEVRP